MQDINSKFNGNASGMVFYAVAAAGVLGLVLGAIGLQTGLKARKDVTRLEEKITTLNSDIATTYPTRAEVQQVVKDIGSGIGVLQEQIRADQAQLAILTQRVSAVKSPGKAEKGGAKEAKIADDSSPAGESGTYAIKSGDTFRTIAQQYGVGIQALVAANPGIDPRRLKIGQKIKLPAGKAQ